MRIATFNVNGIRAAQRRGFEAWLAERAPDVVALQEVRCPAAALPTGVFGDYHLAYEPGHLAGRNGVAVLTRTRPAAVRTWDGEVLMRAPDEEHLHTELSPAGTMARGLTPFASEGRYIEVDLADSPVTVASLYLPKGGLPARLQKPGGRETPDGGVKYQRKMGFLASFARQLDRSRKAAKAAGREFLLLGDLNVAHTRQDLTNWRTSNKAEGFLPEEREWFGTIVSPRTLVDVVRSVHPEADGPYSWWSWMGGAFDRDTGWRIDYHLATPGLARRAVTAGTDRPASGPERVSDHAAVVVDYAD
ncbi:exodeoxyribonuclease III [Janibacter sp. Soil728]|uniref:exodeoxyribonuclease III n=1 Tax=Janibacter sp. Soil728 TaxID=1736393 RepID=UPI0006F2CEE7|nr:exodeoxyribonuclease III [Janibacter sp. Soil728]KRE38844.1 exodeoxyribonuclease III [Janibacter sp. Soil728]